MKFRLLMLSLVFILVSGCASRPPAYVMLLKSPDGSVGKVSFTDSKGEQTMIDQEDQAANMGKHASGERRFKLGEKEIRADFAQAMDSRPQLPAKYIILFHEGSTRVSSESKDEFSKMVADIKSRPAPDITIYGHADTVGDTRINDKLSQKRAQIVSELLLSKNIQPRALEIHSFGEHDPFIKTPDNTPELKNRRVEVMVR